MRLKKIKHSLGEILSPFTPNTIEIQHIIKYSNDDGFVPKLVKYDNGFVFERKNGKKSQSFTYACPFEDGYAFVYDHGVYYYIDNEFTIVLHQDKIKTSEDLASIISIYPQGVKKYVSPEKVVEFRDLTAIDLLSGHPYKSNAQLSKTLNTIDRFVQKNNLEAHA